MTDAEIDALWTDSPSVPQLARRRELARIVEQAAYAKAKQACEDQRLRDLSFSDEVYNVACDECAAAIGRLAAGK